MMKRKLIYFYLLVLSFLAFQPTDGHSDTVYMSEKEAIKWAFPKSQQVKEHLLDLSREQITDIEVQSGGIFHESDKKIYTGITKDHIDGHAIITNEIGKFKHITFIVKVSPKGKVEKIAVLTYRESRGGEVRQPRFLHQYKGKKTDDAIKINRDILNITGATMSVRAMNRGVRKVLTILNRYVIS